MKAEDERIVPARAGTGELKEKASRFLAFAFPASSEEEGMRAVERVKRDYHDATHVAFAWKLGPGETASKRSSDAGEPSGTAGKPIAAAIESAGVTDVAVVVARYFGGTKLGTGGLSRAYREAAARALAAAGIRRRRETRSVVVRCSYDRLGALKRLLRPPQIALEEESYGEVSTLKLAVVPSRLPALLASLEEKRFDYAVALD